jgi:dTDP-4-amino-4,6-dideoxygalactose transaminase
MRSKSQRLKPIYVTRPHLPELSKFTKELEKIWESRILTNMGPYHQKLEKQLKEYLDVPYISLFSNATLALYTALKILKLDNSNIITSPFSFPATSHVIKLVNSTPDFVDIDYDTCCINMESLNNAINIYTKAILPVHVYGNSCDIKEISRLAKKHNLKVVYDAAHCFAPKNEILKAGDLSVLSFHATKVFNTLEGGAIISHDLETKEKIDSFRNFGISKHEVMPEIGFNAKMNELQSLLGILNLKDMSYIFVLRKILTDFYNKHLYGKVNIISSSNYSYYPVCLNNRDEVYEHLKENNIHTQQYFNPLISNLKSYKDILSAKEYNLPIANRVARNILCLPLYPGLTQVEQKRIINLVLEKEDI